MNDRPVIRKSTNSCLESSEEDYFSYWGEKVSSNEELQVERKSEVLWSRNGYLFQYCDSPEEFADLSGRTLSSCSWHNDEFDTKSASKVNASLEAIDDALYEQIKSAFLSEEVFQECCDWAERFPYLRIKGQQISRHEESPVLSASARGSRSLDFGNSFSSLQLEGKKVPLHLSNKPKESNSSESMNNNTILDKFLEEDKESGEYIVLHKSEEVYATTQEIGSQEDVKPCSSLKTLEENVIDKLAEEIWPKVLALIDNLDDSKSFHNSVQLPPLAVTAEQKRALYLPRPRTEGSNFTSTELPKLETLLSVSPKVLQQRDPRNSHCGRPSSEISLSRTSSKPSKYFSDQSNMSSVKFAPELLDRLTRKEVENKVLVLPSLEEHFQDSSSVLRGFHIEPSKKELPSKTVFSSRNDNESVTCSRINENFLPPIVDKNVMPTSLKLTRNLFTFYGASTLSNKTEISGSVKHCRAMQMPATSISKEADNNEATQSQFVKKGSNVFGLKNHSQKFPVRNGCHGETNQDRSITLFPIVTPLTPHEEKNATSRKGLLHSFIGVRKR